MIPNMWYPLFESKKVRQRPVGIQRMGERLVLWRNGEGQAVCMRDRCPHRGVALSRGRVRDGQLECGFHGFRYRSDGACTLMPCEGPEAKIPAGLRADAYHTQEAYGLVWLWWGEARDSYPEIPWFEKLGDRRRGTADGCSNWPLNYVRTLESNFDLHHTPWVHGSLIPTGTRLDPYEVEVEGNTIRTRGEMRREGKDRGMPFRLDFKAPSLSYLELRPALYAVVADCPIDENNTWRFIRYYQDYVRVPVLDRALAWLAVQIEWKLVQFRQDLPMVRTQEPKLPGEGVDHLVRADAGTAAYLKLRRKLLNEAGGAFDVGSDLREARRNRVPDLQPAGEPERHQPADDGAAGRGVARLSR